ncbi:hypothetical protein [Desulfocurvibacter africanus]|nr:hypothetical protein [Desulfocurvibacter africanus]
MIKVLDAAAHDTADQMSEELFSKADANGDGLVNETELAQALSS